ncbi:UNKNOWN [Stylonychia lemnae]|uniref:Uncharacterized protein n=1 Tax=Stylonychia lemnae TaxID=5949 RepID=A0A078A9I3_STYLE|nr:UNKNOWN [Stylonychia lemnae]|eukprot:CDW78920.1 UNKNOWN [Stylonychia lemnae]
MNFEQLKYNDFVLLVTQHIVQKQFNQHKSRKNQTNAEQTLNNQPPSANSQNKGRNITVLTNVPTPLEKYLKPYFKNSRQIKKSPFKGSKEKLKLEIEKLPPLIKLIQVAEYKTKFEEHNEALDLIQQFISRDHLQNLCEWMTNEVQQQRKYQHQPVQGIFNFMKLFGLYLYFQQQRNHGDQQLFDKEYKLAMEEIMQVKDQFEDMGIYFENRFRFIQLRHYVIYREISRKDCSFTLFMEEQKKEIEKVEQQIDKNEEFFKLTFCTVQLDDSVYYAKRFLAAIENPNIMMKVKDSQAINDKEQVKELIKENMIEIQNTLSGIVNRSVYVYLDQRFVIVRKLAKCDPHSFQKELRDIFMMRFNLGKYFEKVSDFAYPYFMNVREMAHIMKYYNMERLPIFYAEKCKLLDKNRVPAFLKRKIIADFGQKFGLGLSVPMQVKLTGKRQADLFLEDEQQYELRQRKKIDDTKFEDIFKSNQQQEYFQLNQLAFDNEPIIDSEEKVDNEDGLIKTQNLQRQFEDKKTQ